jgi:hypothetical protein
VGDTGTEVANANVQLSLAQRVWKGIETKSALAPGPPVRGRVSDKRSVYYYFILTREQTPACKDRLERWLNRWIDSSLAKAE